jgi:hypothetical protein
MQFDLVAIIKRVDDLDDLTSPFSNNEMDEVIKEMPGDRAHGPDGFNGLFLKSVGPLFKRIFTALRLTSMRAKFVYRISMDRISCWCPKIKP